MAGCESIELVSISKGGDLGRNVTVVNLAEK